MLIIVKPIYTNFLLYSNLMITFVFYLSGNPVNEKYLYNDYETRVAKMLDGQTTYYISSNCVEIWSNDILITTKNHYKANHQTIASSDKDYLIYNYADFLESVSKIASSDGTTLSSIKYSPFGSDVEASRGFQINYKYTGKEQDISKLYYYGARYFDPTLGRFLASDNLLPNAFDSQQLNRFSYVKNNPLKWTDPSGHSLELSQFDWDPFKLLKDFFEERPAKKIPVYIAYNDTSSKFRTEFISDKRRQLDQLPPDQLEKFDSTITELAKSRSINKLENGSLADYYKNLPPNDVVMDIISETYLNDIEELTGIENSIITFKVKNIGSTYHKGEYQIYFQNNKTTVSIRMWEDDIKKWTSLINNKVNEKIIELNKQDYIHKDSDGFSFLK